MSKIFLAVFYHVKKRSFQSAYYYWTVFLAKSFIFTSFAKIIEFAILLNYLNIQEGEKICDLGCGCGCNDVLLSLTGAQVCGVDIDRKTLSYAGKDAAFLQVDVNYCVSDLNTGLSFKSQSFDKAVSYCVLEHLHNPEAFLNEVNRLLRPNGTFALSVDSFSYDDVPEDLLDVHRGVCDVKRYYTKKDAEQLLDKCNFVVQECSFRIKSPISSMFFKMLLRAYFSSELLRKSSFLKLFKLFAPIVLVICIISDSFYDDKNGGYWLTILAVKKPNRLLQS